MGRADSLEQDENVEEVEGGEVNTVGECGGGGLERSVQWAKLLVHMKRTRAAVGGDAS